MSNITKRDNEIEMIKLKHANVQKMEGKKEFEKLGNLEFMDEQDTVEFGDDQETVEYEGDRNVVEFEEEYGSEFEEEQGSEGEEEQNSEDQNLESEAEHDLEVEEEHDLEVEEEHDLEVEEEQCSENEEEQCSENEEEQCSENEEQCSKTEEEQCSENEEEQNSEIEKAQGISKFEKQRDSEIKEEQYAEIVYEFEKEQETVFLLKLEQEQDARGFEEFPKKPEDRLLKIFTTHKCPQNWETEEKAYLRRRCYSLYYILPHSDEYYLTAHALLQDGYEPLWMKRIQNGIMFGRYLFRLHQRANFCSRGLVEFIRYMCVPEKCQYLIYQHGVDPRKYTTSTELFVYDTPRDAIINIGSRVDNPILIIARVAHNKNSEIRYSDIYPQYMVKYAPKSTTNDTQLWGTAMTIMCSDEKIVAYNKTLKRLQKDFPTSFGTSPKIPRLWTPRVKEYSSFPRFPPPLLKNYPQKLRYASSINYSQQSHSSQIRSRPPIKYPQQIRSYSQQRQPRSHETRNHSQQIRYHSPIKYPQQNPTYAQEIRSRLHQTQFLPR